MPRPIQFCDTDLLDSCARMLRPTGGNRSNALTLSFSGCGLTEVEREILKVWLRANPNREYAWHGWPEICRESRSGIPTTVLLGNRKMSARTMILTNIDGDTTEF